MPTSGGEITSLEIVERPDANGQTLLEKFRLEYRKVVTTPSGKRFVVTAHPRSLAADLDYLLPWPILLSSIAIRRVDAEASALVRGSA